jgi:hypothetical protein
MENKKRLIDADALCKVLADTEKMRLKKFPFTADGYREAQKIVDTMPAVYADGVVRGQWKFDCACEPYCSNCGSYALQEGFEKLRSNYCPNCGATMDGSEAKDEKV